jgi:hypothetical protein
VVGHPRCRAVQLDHGRVLRVEQAQDVAIEPFPLERREAIGGRPVMAVERRQVSRPAGRVADRVEADLHVGKPRLAVEADAELDDLGIDRRPGVADGLDVELPELAVPAGLGSVVAEHRPGHRQLHRLGQRLHSVLDVRPDNACRRFGAERPGLRLLGSRRDPEQLLLDDVGDCTDPALEDRGLLEHRGLDLAVAVAPGDVGGNRLEPTERGPLGRQQVARPARSSEGRHRAEV